MPEWLILLGLAPLFSSIATTYDEFVMSSTLEPYIAFARAETIQVSRGKTQ